jgi:hypothetical protein
MTQATQMKDPVQNAMHKWMQNSLHFCKSCKFYAVAQQVCYCYAQLVIKLQTNYYVQLISRDITKLLCLWAPSGTTKVQKEKRENGEEKLNCLNP